MHDFLLPGDGYVYCSTSEVSSLNNPVPLPKVLCELALEQLQWRVSVGEELSDISCTYLRQCGYPQPWQCTIMWFWAAQGKAAKNTLLLIGQNTLGQKPLCICMNMETIYKIKLRYLLSHLSWTESILHLRYEIDKAIVAAAQISALLKKTGMVFADWL